jgi:hypothetical protein
LVAAAGRTLALVAALGAATILSSCSYLLGDPYGTIGQRAVAWVDLNGAIKATTGSGVNYVNRMSYLSSAGHDYLFLYVSTTAQTQIFAALDGTSLNLDNTVSSGFYYQTGTNIAVDMNGNFVTSYPVGLALSPTLAIATPGPTQGTFCLAADTLSNVSMTATSASNAMALSSYSNAWGAATVTASPALAAFDPGWALTDAATSGGNLLLLFTNSSAAIEVVYPGTSIYSTLSAQTYIIDNAPSKSAIAYSNSNQMAWATSEGLVVGSYANNGVELDLYKLGDSGKTSSYNIATNGSASFYFEPAGRYFFYYEQSSGRLYKMRTWW